MSDGERRKQRCEKCVFRNDSMKIYKCNYAGITGHTRKAQPPEKCTYFREGERIEDPHKDTKALTVVRRKKKKEAGRKPRYDWDKGMKLYLEGKNDGEIGRAIGCASRTVKDWRQRKGLPANAKKGGQRKETTKNDS